MISATFRHICSITGAIFAVLSLQACTHYITETKEWKADDEKIRIQNAKVLDLYIQDGQELAAYEVFTRPSGGKSDAGPFLNKRFAWTESDRSRNPDLVLPKELHAEFLAQKDKIRWKPDWKRWRLKFGWMKSLKQFDHWNIEKNNPYFPDTARHTAFFFKSPSIYNDIQMWVRLRLAWGRDHNQLPEAFREARQMTALLISHENRVSELIAVGILGIERKFAEIYMPEWKSIPESITNHARRFFYASEGLANPDLPPQQWLQAAHLQAGLCGRVSAILNRTLLIRAYLPEYAKDYLRDVDALERETVSTCRPSYSRELWSDPKYSFFTDEENQIMKDTGPMVASEVLFKDPKERKEIEDATERLRVENTSEAAQKERRKMRSNPAYRENYGRLLIGMYPGFSLYLKELATEK
jgi:hypothetical protein